MKAIEATVGVMEETLTPRDDESVPAAWAASMLSAAEAAEATSFMITVASTVIVPAWIRRRKPSVLAVTVS